MKDILAKLNAAKFDYEYYGKSLEEIAERYNFDLSLLVRHAEEDEWECKIPVVTSSDSEPESATLAEYAEGLYDHVADKLLVMDLTEQLDRAPLLWQLERALLSKAIDCAEAIDPEEKASAMQLKQLEQVIRSIRQRSPLASKYSETTEEESGSKVVVQILNNAATNGH